MGICPNHYSSIIYPARNNADSTSTIEAGGNVCIDSGVNLKTDYEEDKNNVETAPKELLDLIDIHGRRSQPNTKSLLEIILGIESEPKVVFVGASWIDT